MSTYEERQARYAADQETNRRWFWPRLADAYDHRGDGVAAFHKFENALGVYAALFANGSKCTVYQELRQAERRAAACKSSPSAPPTTMTETVSTP
jgi:hypothetical protein